MKIPPVNQEDLLTELLQDQVDGKKFPNSTLNQVTQAEQIQPEKVKNPVKS
ncbi:hypothetical protein GUI12_00970 [Anaplasmataceae bacterium AB001_6]|nr:hypothetical protein GUI12_00970 [Anaplasmataceae bacterium AB001_6]